MIETSNGIPAIMNVTPTNNGTNDGLGGGNGMWWILMYFLFFAMMGNGFFGNNGGSNMFPWLMMGQNTSNSDVQRGFDQQAITTGIAGVGAAVNGLGNQMCNGFAQAEISANARQMAGMNQDFQNQMSTLQQMFNMQQQFANCCCEQRLGQANLTSTILSENCADRNALAQAMMTMTQQNTANTQRLIDTIVGATRGLDDKLCKLELDAKDDKIAELQRQVQDANNLAQFNSIRALIEASKTTPTSTT